MKVTSPHVIVTHQLPDAWIAELSTNCNPLIGPPTTDGAGLSAELQRHLASADGLLTLLMDKIDDNLLEKAPNLRVVSQMAVGVDNIDLDACTRRGIPVGHTPGVLTDATADIAMTLLLATARCLLETNRDAREGRWGLWQPARWLGADLSGATLGIVGMGAIGQATARRAKAFGMNIVYTNRSPKPEAERELSAERLEMRELLAVSDFVSVHTPLSAETHHLIDAAALRIMKPGAILINTARGPVVETDALIAALQSGQIRAAGLDVTDPEPLPPDHVLWSLDNCVIAPHIGSATENTRRKMAELAVANLLAGLRGERLLHCANLEVYEK
jgi:lactate dehydrogenase-like 2-hydroxyacid dehydrogenase